MSAPLGSWGALEAQWGQMIRQPTIFQNWQGRNPSMPPMNRKLQRDTPLRPENTKDKQRTPGPPEAEGRPPPDRRPPLNSNAEARGHGSNSFKMLKEKTQGAHLILNKNEGKIKTFPGNQKTRDIPTNNPTLEKSLKDILEKGGRGKKKPQMEVLR